MSEAYNPESAIYEQLEALEIEARDLAKKRDAASADERAVLEQQLKETESQVAALKRKLKP